MKEHEDCDMVSVEKASVIVDSTVVEDIGKKEGGLGERDEGEDMMVDVVSADAVDLDSKEDSVQLVEECIQKETETEAETEIHDLNMDVKEEVAGFGKEDGCHDSVGTSVLTVEKKTESHDLNMDTKEEVAGSGEEDGCHNSVGTGVLTVEKVEVQDCEMGFESKEESQFGGGDNAGIDGKEVTERGSTVELKVETVKEGIQKETETRDLNMDTKEEVAGSGGEDGCCGSDGSRVLAVEKFEVTVIEESLKTSIEVRDCEMSFESKGEPQSGGDIAGKEQIERGSKVEQHVESVEECIQKETEVGDLNMGMKKKVAGSGEEEACRDSDGSRVLNFEKVEVTVIEESLEVSKDVPEDNVETASGLLVQDSKESSIFGDDIVLIDNKDLKERGSTEDVETASGSLVQHSKESPTFGDDIVVIDNKDITERGSTEEVVEQYVESVEEVGDVDHVMDRKTKKKAEILDFSKIESLEVDMIAVEDGFASKDEAKDGVSTDPSLVSGNNQDSSAELVNLGTNEVDGISKEESLHPIIEVITDNPQENASGDTRFVGGEKDLTESNEKSDIGLPKEIMEQPMECDQQMGDEDCIVNEKIVKESEVLVCSKISEPSTTENPGSEDVDVDVDVVEEGLASKDESQYGVSVDPSLVYVDNRSLSIKLVNSATSEGDVIPQVEDLNQQAEGIAHDAQNLENGTGVGDSKSAADSSQFGGETAVIDIEETEKSLTADDKEIVEQNPELFQEVIHGDGVSVADEKTGKGDEVLDSSKILGSLITANLGSEVVLTIKVEAQDYDSVGQRLVFPHNQSLSTENSDLRAEVETTSKDESVHQKIEVAAHAEVDQVTPVTTANKIIKIESESQDCMVYVEDHVLKPVGVSGCSINDAAVCVKPSNEVPTDEMNGFQVSADTFEEVKHCVVHEGSGFSYEDAHMERGEEDAGMDIDEVLGWKDEIPAIDVLNGHQEKDQPDKINLDSEEGNIASNLVSFKKRKFLDPISDSEKKQSLNLEKIPTSLVSTPKPSFKVGECIQRVASQLTGPVLNSQHVDQLVGPDLDNHPLENKQSSVAEMLSQLHLVAQDPMNGNGYSFLNKIKPFFSDHRAVGRPVGIRKRKTSNENETEEFEFDDVNDSYWTDRIIQNHTEEQLLQENQNGGQERNVVAFEPDKPATKVNRRSNKKRFMFSNHEMGLKEQSELVERRRQNLATEVVLKFPEGIYFPSEIHLNKMFRRFGALMESETEVDRQNGRARVVFKKCSDAEVAHSSAGKFNIFGAINVNYELNYTPLVSYKPLPLSLLQDSMDAS